jgi:ketosteroid isomerase-like protein
MPSSDPERVIRAFYDAVEERDQAAVRQLLADDVTPTVGPTARRAGRSRPSSPTGGR